jgi:hypothetical protein
MSSFKLINQQSNIIASRQRVYICFHTDHDAGLLLPDRVWAMPWSGNQFGQRKVNLQLELQHRHILCVRQLQLGQHVANTAVAIAAY